MATISYGGAKPSYLFRGSGSSGTNPYIGVGFEASGQTFNVGDPLYLSSGKLTALPSGQTFDSSTNLIVGFANQAATGTANSRIEYTTPDRSRVYYLPVTDGSGVLKAGAYADIGKKFSGYFSSTYGLCVNAASTNGTNSIWVVEDIVTGPCAFYNSAAVTDTGVLYAVKYLDSALLALGVI